MALAFSASENGWKKTDPQGASEPRAYWPEKRRISATELLLRVPSLEKIFARCHSAVNAYCQAHDVKNLFVIDGACFPSSPDKPSTLTIMALAWRAAEYLIETGRA